MSVWILESGPARLPNLFRQAACLMVAFNPQTMGNRQCIGGRGTGNGHAAPQRARPEFFKGTPVKDRVVLRFRRFDAHHVFPGQNGPSWSIIIEAVRRLANFPAPPASGNQTGTRTSRSTQPKPIRCTLPY